MKEAIFRYGENSSGLGMVTLPENISEAPVAITLNAGLIHREGPYRLNVLICRMLAQLGYISIRINLSGKGDTPSREGLTNRQSVALDWHQIKQAIYERFGQRNFILIGLCSGADNAIKITAEESDVCGLVIIDPVSLKDVGFRKRQFISKISNPYKWLNLSKNIYSRIRRLLGIEKDIYEEMAGMRDAPTSDEMQNAFIHIVRRQGKVLAFFTSQTLNHYNQHGQFVRALDIPEFETCCTEVFWPLADHVFKVQTHRDRLIERIYEWASVNLKLFKQIKA
ncbi:MAG: hypothetical protein H8D87_13395 [Deltaproteobacteria bacterium]|uniref:hypothetical protein n=1 Tax=Desulfobacula sp. TaxID=2593537 RepID=UPI00198F91D6|nr:hypothetical protein [Candidatus Desulfobacula maris]MBL6992781.1 hypothetical protein [Desulfobacula sp.]